MHVRMQTQCMAISGLLLAMVDYEFRRWTGASGVTLAARCALGQSANCFQLAHGLTPTLAWLMPTWQAWVIWCLYFGWIYVLGLVVPGYHFQGPPIRDGRVLTFHCNGLPILLFTVLAYTLLAWQHCIPWTLAYDHFGALFTCANLIALATSFYLFVRGRWRGLASGQGLWQDFVMGQELVPIVLGLQLNFFWLRPSMMAWLMINLGFLAKHVELTGSVSQPMLLYQIFTNTYIVDCFVFEELFTSTWDIIAEKFGYMLVWGDLVFIPFTFSIQAWFLLEDQTRFHPVVLTAMVALFCLGYSIFRLSNKQKHDFKKDPKALIWGKEPKVLGGRLLVSGWWGIASHINYLGDLLLALAYCSPCGLLRHASFLPWFYFIYLFLLLIHRDIRDDAKCRQKYGDLWVEYRKQVPYRILPLVY